MSEDLNDELTNRLGNLVNSNQLAEQASYNIFGAAVTATRAFDKVVIEVEPSVNRVFVIITLRWWAKFKKFEPLHRAWLARAQERCQEHAPKGWRVLVYYKKGETGETTGTTKRRSETNPK